MIVRFIFSVAWFVLENDHSDLILSEEATTISCDSYEHRVSLGSVGFSRGNHYWEFVLNNYDGNADIAFGIAKKEVNLEKILGKIFKIICLISFKGLLLDFLTLNLGIDGQGVAKTAGLCISTENVLG